MSLLLKVTTYSGEVSYHEFISVIGSQIYAGRLRGGTQGSPMTDVKTIEPVQVIENQR